MSKPIFLERRSYRMRRMMDAVRLLPLLGLALWMVPLMWPMPQEGGVEPTPTSSALIYLFGVWTVLVLAGWLLWRRIRVGQDDGDGDGEDAD